MRIVWKKTEKAKKHNAVGCGGSCETHKRVRVPARVHTIDWVRETRTRLSFLHHRSSLALYFLFGTPTSFSDRRNWICWRFLLLLSLNFFFTVLLTISLPIWVTHVHHLCDIIVQSATCDSFVFLLVLFFTTISFGIHFFNTVLADGRMIRCIWSSRPRLEQCVRNESPLISMPDPADNSRPGAICRDHQLLPSPLWQPWTQSPQVSRETS